MNMVIVISIQDVCCSCNRYYELLELMKQLNLKMELMECFNIRTCILLEFVLMGPDSASKTW
jgi:hypothetical protein